MRPVEGGNNDTEKRRIRHKMRKNAIFDLSWIKVWQRSGISNSVRQELLPVCYQPWWLDAVCSQGEWQVALSQDGTGNVLGVLPWYSTRYFGLRICRMPPLTPYLGPWLSYPEPQKQERRHAFEKKVMKDLIAQLPSVLFQMHHCHPSLSNWLPFYWQGFRQTTRYTFVLEDIWLARSRCLQVSTVACAMRSEKGEKKFQFRESEDPIEVFDLVTKSFKRRGLGPPVSRSFFQNLDQVVSEYGQRIILIATDKDAQPVAGTYLVLDSDTAYCLLIGAAGDRPEVGAVPALLWQAIQACAGTVRRFDFEGSMMQGVAHLFSGFGAKLTPYFQLRKSANTLVELFSLWKGM